MTRVPSVSSPAIRQSTGRRAPSIKRNRWTAQVLTYLGVGVFVLSILGPVLWLLMTSVSSTNDLTTLPLRWFPAQLDLSRYASLLTVTPNSPGETFLYALRNSAFVALVTTFLALLVGIPAAYSFSRLPQGRSGLLYATIATYMMPPVALVLPLYAILARAGLLNNVWGLILVYCTIVMPFTTWLLKANFDGVPVDIEESGAIDGLSRWGILTRLTMPLALPGIVTSTIFSILLAWDEFFYALLFTSNIQAKTLPVAISDFTAGRSADFGLIAAAGVLAALPPVLIAFALQRGLMKGLTAGGVKG
ncbi:carbohydrate ABC transporter permease [Deinococcus deserti]|uniref:Putative sugar ABC transporter, permease component n=1 Tax=Deinococcus deserti (strain DSM 17065 / CIP 109153 / LMG 22923 / VCD115) TaxID=546414 RepID=C1D3Q0_DEIDV|nr:carbohydrate ABC transporter permease [Deinococcus deserti]ACO48129.1 putative sugar ABC transporter, permease component [Deinococcus deserti VCD115]